MQRILTCLLFMAALTMLSSSSVRAASADKPAAVKVAMLFSILKFVEFPEAASGENAADLVIGVVGRGSFVDQIPSLEQQRVGNRTIRVVMVNQEVPLPAKIDVICIGKVADPVRNWLLQQLLEKSMISVSDSNGLIDSGVTFEFVEEDGRIKFDINLDAAQNKGYRLSSKLAGLSRKVIESGRSRAFH